MSPQPGRSEHRVLSDVVGRDEAIKVIRDVLDRHEITEDAFGWPGTDGIAVEILLALDYATPLSRSGTRQEDT